MIQRKIHIYFEILRSKSKSILFLPIWFHASSNIAIVLLKLKNAVSPFIDDFIYLTGAYFGILLRRKVRYFPYNILNNPMYVGASMNFISIALV